MTMKISKLRLNTMNYHSKFSIIILFFVLLLSCNKPIPNNEYIDAPTRFVVKRVDFDESLKNMAIYYIQVIDMNGFNYHSDSNGDDLIIKITDSVDKYQAGDVVSFYK